MKENDKIKSIIDEGKSYLGIELGSTRIKAVLIDESGEVLASGGHSWENKFENGYWTYALDDVWNGISNCVDKLYKDIENKYQTTLKSVSHLGVSAMMHGYLAFDQNDKLLAPFRTWRNTSTGEASEKLTRLFNYNIPQRWSISHLYQAILNGEQHVGEIKSLMTLAEYVHYNLTGQKVLGVGDASGMFPIDIETKDFNATMVEKFDDILNQKGFSFKLRDILPKVLVAGQNAGTLTEAGAKLLDPKGRLCARVSLCPPEGDAGTGMIATNSITKRTGNVSAGTSAFAMIVLEKELERVYEEIDLVTTPNGNLVAMAHCNNCLGELDAWGGIFSEFADALGVEVNFGALLDILYAKALEGAPDCGGLVGYNYLSGEHITGFTEGRPLIARSAKSEFNLANFMRMQISSTVASMKIGLDILFVNEGVKLDKIYGHGGLFKAKETGQRILANAINTPVAVTETAGEGGPWGMAVLASFAGAKALEQNKQLSLDEYLTNKIFNDSRETVVTPTADEVEGYSKFIENYKKGFVIEKAAIQAIEM